MEERYMVSSPPHIVGAERTSGLMREVLIALTPALLASIYLFGMRALAVVAVSIASCLLFEELYRRLTGRTSTLFDLSAAVTGMLLAFNLPVNIPLWMPVIGAFFAMVIVKNLFGGLGQNFLNPALAARVFLANSWSSDMVAWSRPLLNPFAWSSQLDALAAATPRSLDAMSTATPLSLLKGGEPLPEAAKSAQQLWNMVIGVKPGCLGETCGILLMLGGLYLIARGVITWHIPVGYLGTVCLLSLLFPATGATPALSLFYNLFGGGLLLGAFFMATDYVTSPLPSSGRLFYGVCCGLLTVFIRRFGTSAEGVSFAILIMNMGVWFIDRAFMPKRFGGGVPQ
ncbi:MAG: RnfABCDGE type electron transport complex subunit D [Clostridiales bacterium]|nr:RnfABCDGE type electron transport complex subunit D [Clostridiales bacterium]